MSRPKMEITPRESELLGYIAKHGPVSKNTLTDLMLTFRQDVDKYMRRLQDKELIHVDSFGPSPIREGYTVPLYVTGPGEDAKRERKPRKRYKRDATGRRCIPIHPRYVANTSVVIRRDPFIAALFGPAYKEAA